MKKFGIILLSAAFIVLVAVSISSNQSNNKVSQRTVERMSTRATPPPSPASLETGQQAVSPEAGERPLLNPPHGQPYHICEIPVGSPLPTTNQAGTARATGTSQATAAPAATTPVAAAQESPRLNPPHGQPGHICEIPVGSPLPN
jgi:hypothetical protein